MKFIGKEEYRGVREVDVSYNFPEYWKVNKEYITTIYWFLCVPVYKKTKEV